MIFPVLTLFLTLQAMASDMGFFDDMPLYPTRSAIAASMLWTDDASFYPEKSMGFRYTQAIQEKLPVLWLFDSYMLADLSEREQHSGGVGFTYRYEQKPMQSNCGVSLFLDSLRLSPGDIVAQLGLSAQKTLKNRMFSFDLFLPDHKKVVNSGQTYQLLSGYDFTLRVWQPIMQYTINTFYSYYYFMEDAAGPFHGPRFTLSLEADHGSGSSVYGVTSMYDNLRGPGVGLSWSYVFSHSVSELPPIPMPQDGLDKPVWRPQNALVYQLDAQTDASG